MLDVYSKERRFQIENSKSNGAVWIIQLSLSKHLLFVVIETRCMCNIFFSQLTSTSSQHS